MKSREIREIVPAVLTTFRDGSVNTVAQRRVVKFLCNRGFGAIRLRDKQ